MFLEEFHQEKAVGSSLELTESFLSAEVLREV